MFKQMTIVVLVIISLFIIGLIAGGVYAIHSAQYAVLCGDWTSIDSQFAFNKCDYSFKMIIGVSACNDTYECACISSLYQVTCLGLPPKRTSIPLLFGGVIMITIGSCAFIGGTIFGVKFGSKEIFSKCHKNSKKKGNTITIKHMSFKPSNTRVSDNSMDSLDTSIETINIQDISGSES